MQFFIAPVLCQRTGAKVCPTLGKGPKSVSPALPSLRCSQCPVHTPPLLLLFNVHLQVNSFSFSQTGSNSPGLLSSCLHSQAEVGDKSRLPCCHHAAVLSLISVREAVRPAVRWIIAHNMINHVTFILIITVFTGHLEEFIRGREISQPDLVNKGLA